MRRHCAGRFVVILNARFDSERVREVLDDCLDLSGAGLPDRAPGLAAAPTRGEASDVDAVEA